MGAVYPAAPTAVLIGPGLAAGIVGLFVFVDDIGWPFQVSLFAVPTIVSIFGWCLCARSKTTRAVAPGPSPRAEGYMGRLFTLQEPIVNRRRKLGVEDTIWRIEGEDLEAGTRVRVEDTIWRIEGEDLEAGTRVRVVGVDGVNLKVERARSRLP